MITIRQNLRTTGKEIKRTERGHSWDRKADKEDYCRGQPVLVSSETIARKEMSCFIVRETAKVLRMKEVVRLTGIHSPETTRFTVRSITVVVTTYPVGDSVLFSAISNVGDEKGGSTITVADKANMNHETVREQV